MPANFSDTSLYVAEVAPGLEDIASAELTALFKPEILPVKAGSGEIDFRQSGDKFQFKLSSLQTVIAVYSVRQYDIPRPKAFLGHQHFQTLVRQIRQALDLHPAGSFKTVHISAAGSDSSVMQRVLEELAKETGLRPARDEGDLLIRIRRGKGHPGWETLVRLSPRPLATRGWRVRDMPGALNASVANALIRLTNPSPTDTCLNIACGSGTILIERLRHSGAAQVIGCDSDAAVLEIARENIMAANLTNVRLMQADVRALPLADMSVNALYADLPFGNLTGSHDENRVLYPAVLTEAGRLAQVGARFAIITHEVRLMETVIRQSSQWTLQTVRMVTLGGLHPRIYVLVRH